MMQIGELGGPVTAGEATALVAGGGSPSDRQGDWVGRVADGDGDVAVSQDRDVGGVTGQGVDAGV